MDDNQLINEAYNKKIVKEDAGDPPGNWRPHKSLKQEGPYSDRGEAVEGFKVWIADNDIDTSHPSFRLIKEAYIEGFYDAKNMYHEVEDDWEIRY